MQFESFPAASETAAAAAQHIHRFAIQSINSRGEFKCAFSGGRTPWIMLEHLSRCAVPWEKCHVFQVDERVAATGEDTRNLVHIRNNLIDPASVPPGSIHPMPVERETLTESLREYEHILKSICGDPPVLDLVVLGLGSDGHTASLVPGDPVLEVDSGFVGLTGEYQGTRRMTMTYPALNAARKVLWLVTGIDKAEILKAFTENDLTLPATAVSKDNAILYADNAALSHVVNVRT